MFLASFLSQAASLKSCKENVKFITPRDYSKYFLKLKQFMEKNWGKEDSWFDVTKQIKVQQICNVFEKQKNANGRDLLY